MTVEVTNVTVRTPLGCQKKSWSGRGAFVVLGRELQKNYEVDDSHVHGASCLTNIVPDRGIFSGLRRVSLQWEGVTPPPTSRCKIYPPPTYNPCLKKSWPPNRRPNKRPLALKEEAGEGSHLRLQHRALRALRVGHGSGMGRTLWRRGSEYGGGTFPGGGGVE